MTSSKPYLVRAIYEWLADNGLTPYLLVDAMRPGVSVPERHVEDGEIILNVAMQAVEGLELGLDAIAFDARFGGIAQSIYVPIHAVKAIYAFENGRGMVFDAEDEDEIVGAGDDDHTPPPTSPPSGAPKKKGKPSLKIVK